MRFRPLVTGIFALTTLCSLPLLAHGQTDDIYQTPSEQYLSVRRLSQPARGLTPAMIAQNPEGYKGATLEIEGTLSGVVETGDAGALLLLNSERDGRLNLSVSVMPTWVTPGMRLRVLVVAAGPAEGEVVAGIPDLQVVSLASASDIAAAEEQWRQQAAQRAAREKQREAGLKAAQAQFNARSRASYASRSGGSLFSRANTHLVSYLSPRAKSVFPYYSDFVRQYNRRLPVDQADAIAASILLYAEKFDLDPRLMVALIIAESDFRPQETSNKGAMGLGQLMQDEAERLRLSNPYDPVQNIAGVSYLIKERLIKYSGSGSFRDANMQQIILTLASYNAGEGAVKKYGGVPPYRETQNYVKKIERIYRQLCQGDRTNTVTGG